MEDEIYRKSGESEAIGSISGSTFEKVPPSDVGGANPVDGDTKGVSRPESTVLSEGERSNKVSVMQNRARFSVVHGASDGPFAERIEKLRKAVASIMDRLGKTED